MPVCGHPNCDHCGRNRHARKQSFGGRCEGPTRQRFERLLAGLGVKYELTPDGIYDTLTLTGVQTQVRVSDGMVSAYNKYTGDYVHYPMGKRGRGPRNIREFLKAVVNAEGNYNQRQADIALARAKYEAKLLKETELAQTKAKLKAETQRVLDEQCKTAGVPQSIRFRAHDDGTASLIVDGCFNLEGAKAIIQKLATK